MTQEQKAKAYDEALKQIKECAPDENGFITIYPQDIFPELLESEDERIRKELIEYIRKTTRVNFIGKCSKKEAKKFIDWLEKQGEQKPEKKELNKIEQKSAWSEEDEKNLTQCIEAIDACYKWDSMIDWLKSLKQRYTWKPNKEQLKFLQHYADQSY